MYPAPPVISVLMGHEDRLPGVSLLGRSRQRLAVLAGEQAALSDWGSRRRMLGLRLRQRREGDVDAPRADSAVPIGVKALAGEPLYLRPRSSDVEAIWGTYCNAWYRPPAELEGRGDQRIVELGTNIGASLAGMATRYPTARLLGVEPDPENVRLARRNLERFGDRCTVVEAAIWDEDADLVVDRSRREYALVVRPREPRDPPEWPTVPGRSVASVLAGFEPGHDIDFMFIDVEGIEQRILESGDRSWAARVRCIRVECEHEYDGDPQRCSTTLNALGFRTRIEPVPWGSLVFGIREPSG